MSVVEGKNPIIIVGEMILNKDMIIINGVKMVTKEPERPQILLDVHLEEIEPPPLMEQIVKRQSWKALNRGKLSKKTRRKQ